MATISVFAPAGNFASGVSGVPTITAAGVTFDSSLLPAVVAAAQTAQVVLVQGTPADPLEQYNPVPPSGSGGTTTTAFDG